MSKRITGNCDCGRINVEAVEVTVRVMSERRDAVVTVNMCAGCAEATRANGLAA